VRKLFFQHLAGVLYGQCSALAAFRLGRAVQLASCFSLCSAVFSAFLGAPRPSGFRWVCVTSSRELRSAFFKFVNGFIWVQTDNEAIGRTKHCFFNSRPDQCTRITGARRLYGNSCSAALICEFCATRRIRFFVSDLFQKRPSWRGAADAGPFCLKKGKKRSCDQEKNLVTKEINLVTKKKLL
jgi:hypothetical protein